MPKVSTERKQEAKVDKPLPKEIQELRDQGRSYLMFYSGSAMVQPFEGAKEWLAPTTKATDVVSSTVPIDFRQRLSAFNYHSGFTMPNGVSFATREHYHHYLKFINHYPDFAHTFTLNSGSLWRMEPLLAKQMGGKRGSYSNKQTKEVIAKRPANVVVDPEFHTFIHARLRGAIQLTCEQSTAFKEILLATGTAVLTHWTRGKPQTIDHNLMYVRSQSQLK